MRVFNNHTHCAGCRKPYASYRMFDKQAIVGHDGLLYCSQDCDLETETAIMEAQQYNYECGVGEGWD